MGFLRAQNAAILAKIESVEGTFQAPSASTDGVLAENIVINFNPQNVETNEVTGSLDGRGPIPGGIQCTMTFDVYLKGTGIAGAIPEYGDLLKACAFTELQTQTILAGITFSVTGTNTINDSANGLAVLTVGTHLFVSSPANPYAELIVTVSAAGSITVTKVDGSPPGLVNESAGGAWSIIRGLAAVVASAGNNISATAIAPWVGTLEAYRFMPVLLSTNPAVPAFAFIADYSAARLALLTDNFVTPLSATTKMSIPANVVYQPNSQVIPSVSEEYYIDGVVYRFKGSRGSVELNFDAGGACKASFSMQGLFHAKADAAVPVVTYDGTRPGTFRNSAMLVDRQVTALGNFSVNNGGNLTFPDDPNQTEGFASPQIVSRKMSGKIDPYATLVATRDIMTDFRLGNQKIVHGRVMGGNAFKSGNRVALTVPAAQYTGYSPGNKNGLATEQVDFFPYGPDAGAGLCIW